MWNAKKIFNILLRVMNSIEKFYENVFLYFQLNAGLLSGLRVNAPIINIVGDQLNYVCIKDKFLIFKSLSSIVKIEKVKYHMF